MSRAAERLAPMPEPMLPAVAVVRAATREMADTVTLALDLPPASVPRPGQFNMLYAFGVGEVPISISGGCTGEGPALHTVRSVGAVSRALAALQPGEALGVRGPFGRPWPVEAVEAGGGDLVVIAGGIGLAPLRPVLRRAHARTPGTGRTLLLLGARDPASLLYPEEVARWAASGRVAVAISVDHAAPGWTGRVGFVTTLIGDAVFDAARATAFLCGPEVMMRHCTEALIDRGMAPARIFVSMERNMKCALGTCGHCQFGPDFVCRDGPVFGYDRVAPMLKVREL